jgi:hypothetical protein
MFCGVALAYGELPTEIVERYGLAARVHNRGGEREIRFLLAHQERALPVWIDGQLQIIRWGYRRGQSRGLPCTGWTSKATLENGGWGDRVVSPVAIPANMGLDGGVWFRIRQGVRGVAVQDEQGTPVVYVLCEPASHYYQVMTRSAWMPVLVGERI